MEAAISRTEGGATGRRARKSKVSQLPSQSQPPVIVLVRPQLGENIGKAARAMLNFGLVEMRLVTPRDGWPNPQAGPAASGADIVLERAKVYESVAEAVADCAQVYATTVRKRGVTKPVVTPEEAARESMPIRWAARRSVRAGALRPRNRRCRHRAQDRDRADQPGIR